MCVSKLGIPGARAFTHAHMCGQQTARCVGVGPRIPGMPGSYRFTSQISFLSLFSLAAPTNQQFSLHCCFSVFLSSPHFSEPLLKPEG